MTYPRRQLGFATHKECAHFSSGLCTLNGVPVGPDQPACPNFTPKDVMTTPQTVKHQQPRLHLQPKPYPVSAPPFRQSFLMPPSYPQTPYTTAPHLVQSYLMLQRGYSVPQKGGAGFYSMSSRGGGGGRGRSGGGGGGGRGRGRMGGFAAGPGGSCVCPSCGYTAPHRLGAPCFQQTCPKCGMPMTRKR